MFVDLRFSKLVDASLVGLSIFVNMGYTPAYCDINLALCIA
jgi:hypothetical protein